MVRRSSVADSLPRYTRDPETSSIVSEAPSYASAAPSYHSDVTRAVRQEARQEVRQEPRQEVRHEARQEPRQEARREARRDVRRLSTAQFAPGFTSRSMNPDIRDLEAHSYNISHWSSLYSGPQARHYHSVANRRATIASAQSQQAALMSATAESALKLLAPGPSSPNENLDPLEDPYIVGTKMAEQARKQRMSRLGKEQGLEVLRQEDRNWDFMLGQMADWKEREKSWEQFRKSLDSRKGFFRRRVGI